MGWSDETLASLCLAMIAGELRSCVALVRLTFAWSEVNQLARYLWPRRAIERMGGALGAPAG
jgi:hypothetical protein